MTNKSKPISDTTRALLTKAAAPGDYLHRPPKLPIAAAPAGRCWSDSQSIDIRLALPPAAAVLVEIEDSSSIRSRS
jgi:hypothetical protein